MERIFAIGDIHGCSKTFDKLLTEKIKITKEDDIYCIGDYIDRGPDSKGVLDRIMQLRREGYKIHTLRGNHEQMMLEASSDKRSMNLWLDNGGKSTMKSFGIKSLQELPPEYLTFLNETEFYLQKHHFIFVHAGLNFKKSDLFEDKQAMLWERDFFPQQPELGDRLMIHGHTPIPLTFVLKQRGNCINIDGGCVYSSRPQFGNLVALDCNKREFLIEENCE
ncbi:MAG: metallophosphoesterase family protein [Ginsengibacter sp.]